MNPPQIYLSTPITDELALNPRQFAAIVDDEVVRCGFRQWE